MIKNFYFFTATILEWKHILGFDKYKDIIIESFKFNVKENRVRIFAFVIMPNHFHTVWKINDKLERSDFQRDTLKFISQTMLRELKIYHPDRHKELYVGAIRHGGPGVSGMGKKSVFSSFVYTKSS